MKKRILSGFGVLFCVAILISGCSKPEEKKVEAPPVQKQIVQEKAPAVKQEVAEKLEPAAEAAVLKGPTMTDHAIEASKEMREQALKEKAIQEGMKLPSKY